MTGGWLTAAAGASGGAAASAILGLTRCILLSSEPARVTLGRPSAFLVRAGVGLAIGGWLLPARRTSRPRSTGAGDVKLAGLIGLVLGSQSLAAAVAATLLGLAIGAVTAVAMTARHRKKGVMIALGPAMIAGALITAIGATR